MKTLNSKSITQKSCLLRKVFVGTLAIFFSASMWSQTYNPDTGNTHYPNGTIYIGTSTHTGGPVVTGPEREDGSWERVECDENQASEKRCAEILEEATPDKDGKTGDSGSGESSTQTLDAELAAEVFEYRTKQLKIKHGVWAKQNGKWISASNPNEWTNQIIRSWKKKK